MGRRCEERAEGQPLPEGGRKPPERNNAFPGVKGGSPEPGEVEIPHRFPASRNRRVSVSSHRMCPTATCASWIRGVLLEGTQRAISASEAGLPPSPTRAIVTIPCFFATRNALSTLGGSPPALFPNA